MPGPGWYLVGEDERRAVLEVLTSRHLTRYRFDAQEDTDVSKTMLLERALSKVLHVDHVLAVNSGTSALLCGLQALGIGPGDEVIVPGYTFIASIASVVLSGATAVLAEVDESLTIDPDDVRRKLTPSTKAIMAVHMIGGPADLSSITDLARACGCAVVEDVAQALGGRYRGAALGTVGDVGAFSLNVGKTITSGDGGFLTTRSRDLYERAFSFHDHGFRPDRAGVADDGPMLGLNLRMNELAGALALAQVSRLDDILARCRHHKGILTEVLSGLAGVTPRRSNDPEGDCATAHVLRFDSAQRARTAAAALGGRTLAESPKHNYATMPQLARFRGTVEDQGRVRHGHPGHLPRTDALLGRCVALSIGVVDGYLGTLGGIDVLDDPQRVRTKAERVLRIIEASA